MTYSLSTRLKAAALGAGALVALTGAAHADQVFNDDVIVSGSLCVGFDCVNGETFGFDTIKLKENNTRIKFEDTSSSGSFPTADWQLTANDSANGGASKFSIDDIDNSTTPFTVSAGARANSIFVNSSGRVGFGTSTPSVDMHVRQGNSPTLRLEQDGSSGFAAQSWDVAGNETNFFIRDVTNGSQLPLRIRPSAPSNSVYVDTDGDIGMGTASPLGEAQLTIVSDGSDRGVLRMVRNGGVGVAFDDNGGTPEIWTMGTDDDGTFNIALVGTGILFSIDSSGNATFTGTVTATPGGTN